MRQFLILLVILVSLPSVIRADFGPCRYDPYRCSCKLGVSNQGICWDKTEDDPNICKRRFCRPGWTCSCGGRTHVCWRSDHTVHTLNNPEDKEKITAPCSTQVLQLVSGHEITLGSIRIHISRTGALANDCNQIAWWHNGELMGNYPSVPGIDEDSVDAQLVRREDHSLLELRPGDLIAFRFRESSYYCYNHLTEMIVNGTAMSSMSTGVTTYFSRKYTKDWFMPSYQLDSSTTATDEEAAGPEKFVQLRRTKLTNGEVVVPGEDMWRPRRDSNADNRRSNWYFRVQLPNTLPTPGQA